VDIKGITSKILKKSGKSAVFSVFAKALILLFTNLKKLENLQSLKLTGGSLC